MPSAILNPKKIGAIIIACSMAVAVQAQLVDDFSGNLNAYTLTPVLYAAGTTPATTTISFANGSGSLQANAVNFNDIEQVLFLRSDFSLSIGQMLTATVNWTASGSQDFGIAVASTATPPAASAASPGLNAGNTRTNLSYAFIGIRSTAEHVVASGFDGTTGLTTLQYQPGSGNTTTLFISRTSATTFQMGFNASTVSTNGGADILATYTFANSAAVGTAIGFYADMRANGSIGTLDNLTITTTPEPSTLALSGMGLASLFVALRRKK